MGWHSKDMLSGSQKQSPNTKSAMSSSWISRPLKREKSIVLFTKTKPNKPKQSQNGKSN